MKQQSGSFPFDVKCNYTNLVTWSSQINKECILPTCSTDVMLNICITSQWCSGVYWVTRGCKAGKVLGMEARHINMHKRFWYLPNSSLCQGSFIVTVRECEWKICTWTIARCSSYVFPISRILQYTGSRWVISSSKHLTPLFLWKENKFAACFLNNTCKSWSSRHSVFGSCLNKNYFATLKFATLCLCFYWTSQANSLWTHLGASTHYSAVQLIHFRTVHS